MSKNQAACEADMSGARLVLHLAFELKRRGGGQGDALLVRVPA